MIQKYIIDKTDLHDLLTGKEIPLPQGNKARAFCVEVSSEMTNGEVVQALFPYAEVVGGDEVFTGVRIDTKGTGTPIALYTDWWNAPYKAESEDI